MRKKYLLLLVVLFCFTPLTGNAQEVVSVLYFENTTKQDHHDWLRKGLADMLITDISQAPQIKVVEREALEKILKEQALALTGAMDEKQTVSVGKLLNAHKLIYGSYIVTGKQIRVDAKISDVKTGTISTSIGMSGELKQIFKLEKALAKKILSRFAVSIPEELEINPTDSVDALQSYYEGITLFDRGQFEKAKAKFLKAQNLDPLYIKPQQGLAAAYRFLKDFKKLRQQREISKLYQFAGQLKTRLATPKWKTYADIVRSTNYAALSDADRKRLNEKNNVYIQCNTPTECTWRLMLAFSEIGQKSVEYFDAATLQKKLRKENVRIAETAKERFKNDPFLAEILAYQLYELAGLKDYPKVKAYAEEFMLTYPDYRMIETIEGHYEKALAALGSK